MEDSKKRSRYLVGLSEASPARDFRLALFVLARARVVSLALLFGTFVWHCLFLREHVCFGRHVIVV